MSSTPGKIYLLFAILCSLLLTGGCGGLPDYAQPHLSTAGGALSQNSVAYRKLTRADFMATSVPERLSKHKKRLNAHTAVSIRPVAGAKYIFTRGMIGDQPVYHGRVENLAFAAVMIPEQSWWNPTIGKKRQVYVLQHEQIHFALMELAARKLTQRVKEDPFIASVYGSSALEVRSELQKVIERLLEDSQRLTLKSHTEFDEDTSMRYSPAVQQEWHDEVMAELARLPDGSHPGTSFKTPKEGKQIQ